jgi:hypothetical protein
MLKTLKTIKDRETHAKELEQEAILVSNCTIPRIANITQQESDYIGSRYIAKLKKEEQISCIYAIASIFSAMMYHQVRDYSYKYGGSINEQQSFTKNIFLLFCSIATLLFSSQITQFAIS